MEWLKETLEIRTPGKGLHAFTDRVVECLRRWKIQEGMCFLYIPHTSASLVVSENYDPTAKADLEAFMDRLAPPAQGWHEHTLEGSDDSPSHMRAMLTHTSLSIPIDQGRLSLGTWQGIYLFEHRRGSHTRQVILRGLKVT